MRAHALYAGARGAIKKERGPLPGAHLQSICWRGEMRLTPIEVRLSGAEVVMAATVGIHRQIEALRRALPDKHGYKGDGWSEHIEGAGGEAAVGRATGSYWAGTVNTFKQGGDVGRKQVRTRSGETYDLIVRDDDPDDAPFFLVTGRLPNFKVWGWIWGRDAKRPEWRKAYGDRPAAFFVPKEALTPLADYREDA
jgi:hypothetical protein